MNNVLVIITEAPYQKDNLKTQEVIRLVGALIADELNVKLALLDSAVELAKKNHTPSEGHMDLEKLILELREFGLAGQVCGKAMNLRGINDGDLIDGFERGSMKSLSNLIIQSDRVLTF